MYQFSYAEVLEETPQTARQRERHAIEHSIQLLQAAEKAGVWIMREAEQIRLEKSDNFKAIIEVSQSICEGLA